MCVLVCRDPCCVEHLFSILICISVFVTCLQHIWTNWWLAFGACTFIYDTYNALKIRYQWVLRCSFIFVLAVNPSDGFPVVALQTKLLASSHSSAMFGQWTCTVWEKKKHEWINSSCFPSEAHPLQCPPSPPLHHFTYCVHSATIHILLSQWFIKWFKLNEMLVYLNDVI